MARVKHVRRNSPGLVFILLTLVIVAVVGARFFDFGPSQPASEPLVPPEPEQTVVEESVIETSTEPVGKVLVYHTHASENYSPGKSHSSEGKPGDIVGVGGYLASCLEEAGYSVVHDKTINDQPKYSEAYTNSSKVLDGYLAEEEFLAVIDVHRDAIPPGKPDDYTTVEINGRDVAKILFVVGDVNNANLEANLAFAQQLRKKMDEMYPGLARGVKVQHMDYNGGQHSNLVLAHVGDYRYNTVEEAKAAAALFADVLAEVLSETAESSLTAPTTTP